MEYKVAEIGEIEPGQTKIVKAGGKDLMLCNVAGEFFCVDNVCTHDGGTLSEGELIDDEIECPRHGAHFNVKTGAVVTLPAIFPINAYPVKIDGNEIKIIIKE